MLPVSPQPQLQPLDEEIVEKSDEEVTDVPDEVIPPVPTFEEYFGTKGTVIRACNGYRYGYRSETGRRPRWRCLERNCKITIKVEAWTLPTIPELERHENHLPNPDFVAAEIVKSKIRKRAREDKDVPVPQIYNQEMGAAANTIPEAVKQLGKFRNGTSSGFYNQRRKCLPPLPSSISEYIFYHVEQDFGIDGDDYSAYKVNNQGLELLFLPSAIISQVADQVFNTLLKESNRDAHQSFTNFYNNYYIPTWLELFSPSVWRKCGVQHRTNNFAEAWHSKLSKVLRTHPDIWSFVEAIKREEQTFRGVRLQ